MARANLTFSVPRCNRYRYPIEDSSHLVEEAESWLSPVSQPAYTRLIGVNLFGRLNNIDSNGNGNKATNKVCMRSRDLPLIKLESQLVVY